jgi:hypothetical protein
VVVIPHVVSVAISLYFLFVNGSKVVVPVVLSTMYMVPSEERQLYSVLPGPNTIWLIWLSGGAVLGP